MKNDNRPYSNDPDFDRWNEYHFNEWDKLLSNEKAICLSYERAIKSGREINRLMISAANDVHKANPDFHMGHMPSDKNKSADYEEKRA